MCGRGLGTGYARPGPPLPPLFQWCVLHSKYSAFPQVLLAEGQWDINGN